MVTQCPADCNDHVGREPGAPRSSGKLGSNRASDVPSPPEIDGSVPPPVFHAVWRKGILFGAVELAVAFSFEGDAAERHGRTESDPADDSEDDATGSLCADD